MNNNTLFRIPFWVLPLCGGLAWLVSLMFMVIAWTERGSAHFPEEFPNQHLPYISNVGASHWGQPPFLVGSSIMVLFFCSAFGAERWFRHRGLLVHHHSRWTVTVWSISAFLTLAGSASVVLLTIFNVKLHPGIHYPLVAIFMFGYIIAAGLTCVEKKLISRHHPTNKALRISFYVKLFIVTAVIGFVIIFGVAFYCGNYDLSVVVEWIVGLFFTFYIWSFVIDFFAVVELDEKSDRVTLLRESWDEEFGMTMPVRARIPSVYKSYTHLR